MKHEDQVKRETVPSRADLPTALHPCHDLLMVVPIPDITKVGSIYLPDRARIVLNEGHIVEKGPLCTEQFGVGDFVTWDQNSEYRLEVDGVAFILVREAVINMRIPHRELIKDDPAQGKLPLTEGENGYTCPACGAKSETEEMAETLNLHAANCPEDPQ